MNLEVNEFMKLVSMKQLRENFGAIRKGLAKGEKYILLYRSKPLAIIGPYKGGVNIYDLQSKNRRWAKAKKSTLKKTMTEKPSSLPPTLRQSQTGDSRLNKFGLRQMLCPK